MKNLSSDSKNGSNTADHNNLHVVIGGCGYPGYHLGMTLHEKGYKVKLVDVHEPMDDIPSKVTFQKCDIRDYKAVEKGLLGASCVYHLASYGMSGKEQWNTVLTEQVNITGTKNVIKACQQLNVQHLVYTSTYNTVFGGQDIENGDESLPYFPLEKHPDHYSRTKSMAEMMVLDANGSTTSDGHVLYTCALRLGAVYGPGEKRHLPRVVEMLKKGLLIVRFDKENAMTDFLHVDNLVQAHIKAGEALTAARNHIAAGQAYFISDGKPINNFEFFRPLIEGLGYSFPEWRIPFSLVYFLSYLMEVINYIFRPICNFNPVITRAEVNKVGVAHYFSYAKAQKQLGYKPTKQNDLDQVVDWFIQQGHKKKEKKYSILFHILLNVLLALLIVAGALSLLPFVM